MTLGHVPMCRNLALHRLEGTPTSVQPVKPPTGPVPVETVPPDCGDLPLAANRAADRGPRNAGRQAVTSPGTGCPRRSGRTAADSPRPRRRGAGVAAGRGRSGRGAAVRPHQGVSAVAVGRLPDGTRSSSAAAATRPCGCGGWPAALRSCLRWSRPNRYRASPFTAMSSSLRSGPILPSTSQRSCGPCARCRSISGNKYRATGPSDNGRLSGTSAGEPLARASAVTESEHPAERNNRTFGA